MPSSASISSLTTSFMATAGSTPRREGDPRRDRCSGVHSGALRRLCSLLWKMSRHDGVVACVGAPTFDKITAAKILLVGVGGIGACHWRDVAGMHRAAGGTRVRRKFWLSRDSVTVLCATPRQVVKC